MLREEMLDLLLVKFIINLPAEELEPKRLFFHIQEAYWYYIDFIRPLPEESQTYVSFKQFTQQVFNECHLLQKKKSSFNELFRMFSDYITEIPVYGAILLNQTLDKCLLVMNFRCTNYSFPKGKVNENEKGLLCAIREVWEEIGYDIQNKITEDDFIELQQGDRFQKFYILKDIDENTRFKTNTRNEIGKIEWVKINLIEKLALLPGEKQKFWLVYPFIKPLKQWINYQLKYQKHHVHVQPFQGQQQPNIVDEDIQVNTVNIIDIEKQIIAEQIQRKQKDQIIQVFKQRPQPYNYEHYDLNMEKIHQEFKQNLELLNRQQLFINNHNKKSDNDKNNNPFNQFKIII